MLETFSRVTLRMIEHDSEVCRQSGTPPSLQDISRDVVLVNLITSNGERLVSSLVDRLGQNITRPARQILLNHSKRN